jgi:signal transduction histidine kinase
VTLRVRAGDAGATFEVEDTGPGIPREALGRLFQPFERATQRPGGAGLGLATVRRLVEAHGGAVRVTSRVDVGSVFTVELPRAPAAVSARPVPAPTGR